MNLQEACCGNFEIIDINYNKRTIHKLFSLGIGVGSVVSKNYINDKIIYYKESKYYISEKILKKINVKQIN